MLRKLKHLFPGLYDYYRFLCRRKRILRINKMKMATDKQRREIIAKVYAKKIGRPLDWSNLSAYTEKMQWEKLYGDNPMKPILADKYLVREWISEKIGEEYLIPLLGVWDSFDEIDFDSLPNKFVLKTNHGSGTNEIVKDKSKLKIKSVRRKFNDWMTMDFAYSTYFEMHYSKINRKIIAEKYMETDLGELQDYKFLCFDGKAHFCWVDLGRYTKHTRTVFDMDWNLQPWTQATYGIADLPIPKPKNFDKMKELAEKLAQGFPHVRVDFYNVDGTIYFGEMTFTNGSGFDCIVPDKYDFELGKLWTINTSTTK